MFRFVEMQSFMFKRKINLRQKLPSLGIFGLDFHKDFVIFEISSFEIVKMQSFMLKKKIDLRQKLPSLGIFGL